MRSALSLTLVLLAAMSGQVAGACELAGAHHPLRVLLCSGQPQADLQAAPALGLSADVALGSGTILRAGRGVPTLAAACTEPPSRSYEAALAAGLPANGP